MAASGGQREVRRSDRPPLAPNDAPLPFTIGPVDFPDVARDQKATGGRFLDHLRGYSGPSRNDVEHYCLDCTFRPWRDATGTATSGALTATVTYRARGRTVAVERVRSTNGRFTSRRTLRPGETAVVVIRDPWADYSPPGRISRAAGRARPVRGRRHRRAHRHRRPRRRRAAFTG